MDAQLTARDSARTAAHRHRGRSAASARRVAGRGGNRAREARRFVRNANALPYVETATIVAAPAKIVYELAKDQERFPEFMPDVEIVVVLERYDDRVISRWKTLVEEAPIEWIEED